MKYYFTPLFSFSTWKHVWKLFFEYLPNGYPKISWFTRLIFAFDPFVRTTWPYPYITTSDFRNCFSDVAHILMRLRNPRLPSYREPLGKIQDKQAKQAKFDSQLEWREGMLNRYGDKWPPNTIDPLFS